MNPSNLRLHVGRIIKSKYKGVQADAAAAFGISGSRLSRFLSGRDEAGPTMLEALGLERVVSYKKLGRRLTAAERRQMELLKELERRQRAASNGR